MPDIKAIADKADIIVMRIFARYIVTKRTDLCVHTRI